MTTAILQAHSLRKTVRVGDEQLTIIDDISIDLPEGGSLAVSGVSGSGKSTLLALLAGLDVPDSGRVLLAGHDLGALDDEQRARVRGRVAGIVFQSFHLLPGFTALENAMLPLELRGEPDARERAMAFLAEVGLEKRGGHYPRQLSGGEQQRVAIARAFACEPSVLFADEPTGNLDARSAASVADLLFRLEDTRRSALFLVTHDMRMAERCDRRIELVAGRLASES